MNHNELIQRGVHWLRNTRKCHVVLYEPHSWSNEIPDVIGWRCEGFESIVLECKTSVADFKRDLIKECRTDESGMGVYRYYLTPKGLLDGQELPKGWGLIEARHGMKKIAEPTKFKLSYKGVCKERTLLYKTIMSHAENVEQLNTFIGSLRKIKGHFDSGLPITQDLTDYAI